MKFNFVINESGSIPRVFIDQQHLSVVSLTYAWRTKTDSSEGANVCIVDGYLENSTVLRRFLFDILTGAVTEEPLENAVDMDGRIFEVCIESGTCQEMEQWVKTPFLDLKVGNIIRIIDAGRYYRDLDGNGLWTVIDASNIQHGRINVQTYIHEPEEIGHGGFFPGTVKPEANL